MYRSFKGFSWLRAFAVFLFVTMAPMAGAAETLVRFSDGETISEDDLTSYLFRRVDLRGSSRNIWGVQTALREMAMVRALSKEGESRGEKRPEGREEPQRFDDVYAQAVYTKLAPQCKPLSDEAASRAFFKEYPQAFRVPPMARLSRVILPASEVLGGEPAIGWIQTRAQAVASSRISFDEVVKEAETAYKIEPQGDLGWVTLADDDASILRVLASTKKGDLVGPLREGDFIYLFLMVEKRESRQLTWDEVALSVPTRALTFCRQQASKNVREDLFKKYGVELDQAAIRGLFTKQSAAK